MLTISGSSFRKERYPRKQKIWTMNKDKLLHSSVHLFLELPNDSSSFVSTPSYYEK